VYPGESTRNIDEEYVPGLQQQSIKRKYYDKTMLLNRLGRAENSM
jgi:hypothetical protein